MRMAELDEMATGYAFICNATRDARIDSFLYEDAIHRGSEFFENFPFINMEEYIICYKEDNSYELRDSIEGDIKFLKYMRDYSYSYFPRLNEAIDKYLKALDNLYIKMDDIIREEEEEV